MKNTSIDWLAQSHDFEEFIKQLVEIAEQRECAFTIEFLFIARQCFSAESEEFRKRMGIKSPNPRKKIAH